MARPKNRQLVYGVHGVIGNELVIMPVDRARFLALTWKAMVKAKTWGALKTLAPPKAYREILAFQESPRSIRAGHPFYYFDMTPVRRMLTGSDWKAVEVELSLGLNPGPLPSSGPIASALAQEAGASVVTQYVTAFEVGVVPLDVTGVLDARLSSQVQP